MAEMMGSESKYAGQRSGAASSPGTGAKANTVFGSTVVAPPISGALQNIAPGSQDWINYQMAQRIEALRKQYGDQAARRGMLQSGESEKEFEQAVQKAQDEVAAEAGQYTAQKQATADQYAHENDMADKSNKSQERAAMYSGIGQIAPYALFGKWGKDDKTLGGGMWDSLKGGLKSPSAELAGPAPDKTIPVSPLAPKDYDVTGSTGPSFVPAGKYDAGGVPVMEPASFKPMTAPPVLPTGPTSAPNAWDRLMSGPGDGNTATRLGMGALGTGVGTLFSSNKNKTGSILAGLGSTGLSARAGMSGGASAGLGALSSGMLGSIKGNMLGKNNWWKTLLGAGSLAASGGAFGRF